MKRLLLLGILMHSCFMLSAQCPAFLGTGFETVVAIPFTDNGHNTATDVDDINAGNTANECNGNYLLGYDYVYIFTPATTGTYIISLTNQSSIWGGIQVFDACPDTGICVASATTSSASDIISTTLNAGTTYYIIADIWATPNSYIYDFSITAPPPPPANNTCSGAIGLTVNPNLSCGTVTPGTIANATASGVDEAACGGTENDDVWFSFVATATTHKIDLLNVAGSTTDLYHSLWTGGCGSLTLVPGTCSDPNSSTPIGLAIGVTYYLRVYSWNSTTGQTTTFNVCIGTNPPPPANDNCGGALPLTVNPDLVCTTVTPGTIASATASPESTTACLGTENDDVWFSFVATATSHGIELLNVAGSTTNLFHSVWTGGCGTLTLVPLSCSDPDISTVVGLSIGNTYFLRVYSFGSTGGQTTTFNVCIKTNPPPPANDNCGGALPLTVNPNLACGTVTPGTIAFATASPESATACSGTENDDVWFSFVATATSHKVDLLNVAGSTTDLFHSLWTGGCGSLTLVPGTCSDPNSSTPSGLAIGNTYFLRVYSWGSTTGQTTTFNVCIGTNPPPPANDNCGGALPLTVNPDLACGTVTPGTIFLATASPESTTACSGTENDDVWFSFVATATTHKIDLLNVAGSTTDLYHSLWTGGCGSLTLVPGTCSDPNSSMPSGLAIGNTYFLRVYSWGSTTGQTTTFNVCIGTNPPPPINDNACNAVVLTVNAAKTSGTNEYSTFETNEVEGSCWDLTTTDNSVWYSFVAPGSGLVEITTDFSTALTDSQASLYTVSNCNNLSTAVELLCSEDDGVTGSGYMAVIETSGSPLTGGQTYYVQVDGYGSSVGAFEIQVNELAPSNDDCAMATVLAMDTPGSLINQYFAGATASGMGAEACDGSATPTPGDVWYSINTDADGGDLIVIVEPGPNSDVVVAIYDACGAPIPEQCVDLGGNGGIETINFNANFKGKENVSSARDADYFVRIYEKVASGQPFEIGAQGAALPIELGSFEAKAEKRGNRVTWTTLSEVNSDYVDVQSSPNGSTKWESIGKVKTQGESNSRLDYELFDFNPYEVTYYRLNAVDKDGKAALSRVVKVRRSDIPGKITLSPNPAFTQISFQTTSDRVEVGTISIFDMNGRIIKKEGIDMRKGLNTFTLDLEDLDTGLYLFSLQTEDGIKVEKFVKQ